MEVIKLGDIEVEVTLKEIKNVHLSVYPPYGKVKVAAPNRMSLENIKIYTISNDPVVEVIMITIFLH